MAHNLMIFFPNIIAHILLKLEMVYMYLYKEVAVLRGWYVHEYDIQYLGLGT